MGCFPKILGRGPRCCKKCQGIMALFVCYSFFWKVFWKFSWGLSSFWPSYPPRPLCASMKPMVTKNVKRKKMLKGFLTFTTFSNFYDFIAVDESQIFYGLKIEFENISKFWQKYEPNITFEMSWWFTFYLNYCKF